jgi:phosphatidylethanolamine/phosphatidyl-N-methylethanolamine N-methyltransferase
MTTRSSDGLRVFLRAMMANPKRVGAVLPSGAPLARLMASHVPLNDDGPVLEIGAGTGVVTAALIDAGLPPERLFVLELDARLHRFLRDNFPGATVLRGDAARMHRLVPPHLVGKVSIIVSSLPLRAMDKPTQRAIVDSAFEVLKPGGSLIQYTYPPLSPLPHRAFGLKAQRLGRIWLNVPPAAVWRFTKPGRP